MPVIFFLQFCSVKCSFWFRPFKNAIEFIGDKESYGFLETYAKEEVQILILHATQMSFLLIVLLHATKMH